MDSDWTGMSTGIARRDVLRLGVWGTLLGILPGCDTPPKAGACQLNHPIIDVHCHFFNAADVPVEGLVRYVALRETKPQFQPDLSEQDYKRRLDALIVIFVVALGNLAPTAKSELAVLKRRAVPPPKQEIERRQNEQLEKAFELLVEMSQGGSRSADEFAARSMTGAPDYSGLLAEFTGSADLPATFQRRAQSMTPADIKALAKAARSDSKYGNFFSFIKLMQSYREELARTYIRIFASKCQMSLITPSFLDFEKSLAGRASPQRDQIDVMEAVQRKITLSTGIHMHCFAGFDPRREADDPGSAMENIRHAIMDSGFIGVKLYPPMGFKAWGNDDPKIDAALARLYDWCDKHEVPIMAHAQNSIGAHCGYGSFASPEYWKNLLESTGNKYKDLHINLAHFGGFDEDLHKGEPTGVMVSCSKDRFDGPPTWEDIIGDTFDHGRRPNLFADLSCLTELVSSTDTGLQEQVRDHLSTWLADKDPESTQLMFGTDWSMMALQKNYNSYVSRIVEQLTMAKVSTDHQQNILWRNAARYLRIDRPGQTRNRLSAYCTKAGIDPDWLSTFALA